MIEGSRRPIASRPLTRPRTAPNAMPTSAASHGLTPATINSAAMTAEKLNIHPTERSISRMASRNTMPSDSMPSNVVLPRIVSKLIGLRKRGRASLMTTIITSKATMTPISSGKRDERRRRPGASAASGSGDNVSFVTLLLPRQGFRRDAPAWDRRLQSVFDPQELAVDRGGAVAHQIEDQIGRFFRIVAACLFDPIGPLQERSSR